jgi:hypothetical protein
VPETLAVHLNRDEPRALDPEAAAFETDRSFVFEFVNHGQPLHVHLHPSETLDGVASPAETQVYVDEEATRRVEFAVARDAGPVDGHVDVVTGYGAEESRVDVSVTDERKDGGPDVAVDQSLAEKHSQPESSGASLSDIAVPAAVGALVVIAAVGVALSVSDTAALAVGALGVLAGVGVAVYELSG